MKPSRAAALQAKAFQSMEERVAAMEILLAKMDSKLNIIVRNTKAPAKKTPEKKAPVKKAPAKKKPPAKKPATK